MKADKKGSSGSHHCSLKRFLKSEHKDFYKLLKNTFCADFIFNESKPKTILIPEEKLLESIKDKAVSKPQEAFDDIKSLILESPFENLAEAKTSEIVNLKKEHLKSPFKRGEIEKVEYKRWVDKDDYNHDKKMSDSKNVVLYIYYGSEVPKSSKEGGKLGGVYGGSDVEEVDIYSVLVSWLTKFKDAKDHQLSTETCAVNVLTYLQKKHSDLFDSVAKFVVCPNALITLYGSLLLLNSNDLREMKPVVESLSVDLDGAYAKMVESVKQEQPSDRKKIVESLLKQSNKYDMYAGMISAYSKLVEGHFEGVKSVPKSKLSMYKMTLDEMMFNSEKNGHVISKESIDDMLCTVKLAKVMQNHTSLYNPLLLNGVNYTFGSADANKLIEKESVKYLTEFIGSKHFMHVNDASGIKLGGSHDDHCKLSVLKDLLEMIQEKIRCYEGEEKKGEGKKNKPKHKSTHKPMTIDDSDSD